MLAPDSHRVRQAAVAYTDPSRDASSVKPQLRADSDELVNKDCNLAKTAASVTFTGSFDLLGKANIARGGGVRAHTRLHTFCAVNFFNCVEVTAKGDHDGKQFTRLYTRNSRV